MLLEAERQYFPYGPGGKDSVSCVTKLITKGEQSVMQIPIGIRAPYFEDPPGSGMKFGAIITMLETRTLGAQMQNIFASAVIGSSAATREWMRKAVDYDSGEDSKIIMVTHRSRLLVIPRNTVLSDIFRGSFWPRKPEDGPIAFTDLRRTPRARPHEVDGVSFTMGHSIEMLVVPNTEVRQLVQTLEDGFRAFGLKT